MASSNIEESIPDPFEVGDDELDEASHSDNQRSNAMDETEPLSEEDIGGSYKESAQNIAQDIPEPVVKDSPPGLPPKEVSVGTVGDLRRLPVGIDARNLIAPSLFLPIPDSDPLTHLLAKYIPNPEARPRRDTSGDYEHADLETLVSLNSFRAIARMAGDKLVSSDPTDIGSILELWSLRLNSLARLRFYNQTSAECTALFNGISSLKPPTTCDYIMADLIPLDLELLRSRTRYWANDQMGYVDSLMLLQRKYSAKARKESASGRDASLWVDKAARVGVVLASQLVEMKQYTTATRLLEGLAASRSSPPQLRTLLALIYLQIGDLGAASTQIEDLYAREDIDPDILVSTSILKAVFLGEWDTAISLIHQRRNDPNNEDKYIQKVIDANNLAVVFLSQGRLSEVRVFITIVTAIQSVFPQGNIRSRGGLPKRTFNMCRGGATAI
ncbi:hypothetical protein FRC17_006346 [Serendipita sp. 399]|nr:hypothetical protein FRC17_006346 [Serendipita sp. 399]